METTLRLGHNGWTAEETEQLWKEIRAAADSGAPLRDVFERTGQALGRKPNSVRNYYYMQLRSGSDESLRRAAPFETFTDQEIHDLLRAVLSARGRDQSVRACVTELAGGDRTLTLRYQNKYRSILRKKPDLIRKVCQELESEGVPCPLPPVTVTLRPMASVQAEDGLPQQDPDVRKILQGLSSLAGRARQQSSTDADRLRVQRDLLLIQVEDLQLAARQLIAPCKDFLGAAPEDRAQMLPSFCDQLAQGVAKMESASG